MHSTISAPQQTTRPEAQAPSPHRIYGTLLFSHALADALKAAIELDVFNAIGEGSRTIENIAHHCVASVGGMRSVCDFLVVDGFLMKTGDVYDLAGDSRHFLDLLRSFDRSSCESLLRKIHRALRVGGRFAVVELLPEPDRVTPPFPAMFSSGFHQNMASALSSTPQTLILSTKE